MIGKKRLFTLLAVLLLCFLLSACGSAPTTNTPTTSGASATATSAPAATATSKPSNGHHQVGETVKVGVWEVTINSATTSAGDANDTPKNGQYVILDITFQNTDTSTASHTVSSLLQFTFKDATGEKYDEQITSLPNVTSPDGDVNGGDKVRGQVVYDVPTSQHQFTWSYAAILVPESGTWDISV